jgi:hypothetical protein
MYEELQIIRATQETEEELKKTSNELCDAVVDIDQQVKRIFLNKLFRFKPFSYLR